MPQAPGAGEGPEPASLLDLRLLLISDLHVHLLAYDYYRDLPDPSVGAVRLASLIGRARAEAANVLLFDNGDFLQGSPMGDYMAFEDRLQCGAAHPMLAALGALGVDAGTLGNHEFNYGLPYLLTALKGAAHPLVVANLAAAPGFDGRLPWQPWAILERRLVDRAGWEAVLKIGVIGFTPPQIAIWDRASLSGRLEVSDILAAARVQVPALRAAGADLVVALSHSGITARSLPGAEHASLGLAAVPGIDVVMMGHQHLVFPGPDFAGIDGVDAERGTLLGKPAVMPGHWGSHLGVIDLALQRNEGGWRIAAHTVEARPISQRTGRRRVALVEDEPALTALAAPAHAATLAYVRRPVGRTRVPIESYFALVRDSAAVQLVNDAQRAYARTLLAGTREAGLPLLSAAAVFKAGGRSGPDHYTDVPAGDVALRNIADVYLYPNRLRVVLVDGATLQAWLERAAGLFLRIDPEAGDQPLIDESFPTYNFDVIDGVTYAIDVTRPKRYGNDGALLDPAARRIRGLAHGGRRVAPDDRFLVVTNDYRAEGGGRFPGLDGSTILHAAPDLNRDVILRYVQEQGEVAPAPDHNWRLCGQIGAATPRFLTGPGAAPHLADPAFARPLGPTPLGFAAYALLPPRTTCRPSAT